MLLKREQLYSQNTMVPIESQLLCILQQMTHSQLPKAFPHGKPKDSATSDKMLFQLKMQ